MMTMGSLILIAIGLFAAMEKSNGQPDDPVRLLQKTPMAAICYVPLPTGKGGQFEFVGFVWNSNALPPPSKATVTITLTSPKRQVLFCAKDVTIVIPPLPLDWVPLFSGLLGYPGQSGSSPIPGFPSGFPFGFPSGFPAGLPSGFPAGLPSGFPPGFPQIPGFPPVSGFPGLADLLKLLGGRGLTGIPGIGK